MAKEFDIEVVNGIGVATMRSEVDTVATSGVDAMAEVGRPHHIPAGVVEKAVKSLESLGIKVKL